MGSKFPCMGLIGELLPLVTRRNNPEGVVCFLSIQNIIFKVVLGLRQNQLSGQLFVLWQYASLQISDSGGELGVLSLQLSKANSLIFLTINTENISRNGRDYSKCGRLISSGRKWGSGKGISIPISPSRVV